MRECGLAVEATNILAGPTGFQTLCTWLYAQDGKFTKDQLKTALPDLGFPDPDLFLETMQSPAAAQKIAQDIQQAESQNITTTPAILINGHPLQGLGPRGHLTVAIEEILAAGG